MSSKSFTKFLRKIFREELQTAVGKVLTENATNQKKVI